VRRDEPRKRTNPLRVIVAALILLLAGVAIALALSLGSGNKQDISRSNVHDQVHDLIVYIHKHTQ
jgi:hypothetical protein